MLFNQPRASRFMRELGIDALIATSATNVRYFTGYSCWLDPLFKEYMMRPGASSELAQRAYAVFRADASRTLIVKSLMAADAGAFEGIDLRLYGDPGLDFSLPRDGTTEIEQRLATLLRDAPRHASGIEALGEVLRERGIANGIVGIELEGLSQTEKESIRRALPHAQLRDATNLIRLIRSVKTADEIRVLERAAAIAEQAAIQSLELARNGGRAQDLVEHFRKQVASDGAAFDHFSFSLSGLGICSDLEYRFRRDDVVFIDYGCLYRSYFSDTGTTLAFVELSPELARRHAVLHACVEAGRQAMKPGTKASAVQKAMHEVLDEGGITACFAHGHGMGLEVRDYPILVPATGLRIHDDCIDVDSDLPMEEGMVNNLEAPLFMATAGALQVEKTFVVSKDGSHELTPQDRSRARIAV